MHSRLWHHKRMYSIEAQFSGKQIALASMASYIETFRPWIVAVFVVWLTLLLWLTSKLHLAWLFSINSFATGFAFGLTGALVGFLALCILGVVQCSLAHRRLRGRPVVYRLSEEGCDVASDDLAIKIPWRSIVRASKYPSVLLLEISEKRSRQELTQSIRQSLRREANLSVLAREGWGFPVFWALPLPFRRFVALPSAAISKQEVSFIQTAVHGANQVR